jgi:hypothetical protein
VKEASYRTANACERPCEVRAWREGTPLLTWGRPEMVCKFARHALSKLARLVEVRQSMSDPWQIFRYRPVNDFLWQELELAQFYCCSPLALNDPFDCRIDWRASLERALASPRVTYDRRRQLYNS